MLKEIFGGLNRITLLLICFIAPLSAAPNPNKALEKWCDTFAKSENLEVDEAKPERVTFISSRKVGIGEARRMMVKAVRSINATGIKTDMLRISFKERDKRRQYQYIKRFIGEVVYRQDQIFYGLMEDKDLQLVQTEDYGDSETHAIGYPAPNS
jgi:hypothetical protein